MSADAPPTTPRPTRRRSPKSADPPAPPTPPQEPAKRTRKAKAQTEGPQEGVSIVPTSKPQSLEEIALAIGKTGDLSQSEEARQAEFEQLEGYVTQGLASYYITGLALGRIRDAEMYKLVGMDWQEYLTKRWDLNNYQRAHQMIRAAQATERMRRYLVERGETLVPLPYTESHAYALADLSSAEQMAKVWKAVLKAAPEKLGRKSITAGLVEEVRQKALGFAEPKKLTTKPKVTPEGEPTGEEEPAPTPPTGPEPGPQLEHKATDLEPPAKAAPRVGEEPDAPKGAPAEVEAEPGEVLMGGEKVVQTPVVALEYVIRGLKKGYFSHRDPQIVAYVQEVSNGLAAWIDSPTDEVDWEGDDAPPADDPSFDATDAEKLASSTDAEIKAEEERLRLQREADEAGNQALEKRGKRRKAAAQAN